MPNDISKRGLYYASFSTTDLTQLYHEKRGTTEFQYAPAHREFLINSLLTLEFGEEVMSQFKTLNTRFY